MQVHCPMRLDTHPSNPKPASQSSAAQFLARNTEDISLTRLNNNIVADSHRTDQAGNYRSRSCSRSHCKSHFNASLI